MSLRYVAPAGAPIGARHLARWAGRMAASGDARQRLAAAVAARVGVPHAWTTCTGRAGMTVLLRALAAVSRDRTEVLIPAYTCYSVAASVVRAGLVPRLVDIDPATLDVDPAALEAVDPRAALAIIATNLYGLPNDLPRLVAWARPQGVFVIDDAAQALGASSSGRSAGTWGDAGLFSLDKGKNVSAIDGGILVTRSDTVRDALEREVAALADPGLTRRVEHVVKTLVYAGLLHPRLYWVPQAIPQLGLGKTVYTLDFAIEAQDPSLAALGEVMLGELDRFTATRRAHAGQLIEAMGAVPGIRVPAVRAGSTAAWLRLPILVEDPERRERLLAELQAAGIGATTSYPASLADVPEVRALAGGRVAACPGAREVASRIVTLPTHPYVTAADIRRIAAIVRGASPAETALGAVAS